ncbi:PREDICTED: polycystic kidney disease 2-like 2 protein [Drosophila arizonae]|uniref:Polycystic kidney disease 2-like 2 protein n=1 Tax=Drosophila arizonae TaxID=7263 RepID=A0ABM1PE08_DROAR|nr:PREDICTED: polycystic kidney disease 2-like 2 protein [Drosophila arizonae]
MGDSNRYRATYGDYHYTTEKATRKALLHMILFVIFLTCATKIGHDLIVHEQYFFIKGFRNLLETPDFLNDDGSISFSHVITITDFWDFLQFGVLSMLHGNVNNHSVNHLHEHRVIHRTQNLRGRLFLDENLLLGPPRLRQVRVKQGDCEVPSSLLGYFNECYMPYSKSDEATDAVYKGTRFYTMDELETKPIEAPLHTYHTGGYVKLLSYEAHKSLAIVRHLRSIKWLDRASRLVLLEMNMINLNMDLILSTKLTFEIMTTGFINTKYNSQAFYTSPLIGGFATECSIVIYIINVYYTYLEVNKITRIGLRLYFKKFSTYTFVPSIFICYTLIYMHISSTYYSAKFKSAMNSESVDFVPLDHLLYTFSTQQILVGFLVFFSWMGLLAYIDFVPLLRTLGCSIKNAFTDLAAFFIMVSVAFLAFALLGMCLFGEKNSNFKNISSAFLTMLRMTAGDFNYFELAQEFPVWASLYFFTYVLFIFFVALNMILVVIVLAYKKATALSAYKPSFLLYYIRKQIFRLTCGLCKPPRYPHNSQENQFGHMFNEERLQQLYITKEFTEIESDLNILHIRLNLIDKVLNRFTNNMDDIIANVKKQNKQQINNPETV